jgi:SET domain-containing protein
MPRRYPQVAVKRSTTGLGLFALEAIPAGKPIIEYKGSILSEDEAEEKGGKYLYGLSNNRALDGSSRKNPARYINHSCKPNAADRISRNRVWIWSLQDIEAGEEITTDYGLEYFDQYIKPIGCLCVKCASRSKTAKHKNRR